MGEFVEVRTMIEENKKRDPNETVYEFVDSKGNDWYSTDGEYFARNDSKGDKYEYNYNEDKEISVKTSEEMYKEPY
jgi:hypothetical protein